MHIPQLVHSSAAGVTARRPACQRRRVPMLARRADAATAATARTRLARLSGDPHAGLPTRREHAPPTEPTPAQRPDEPASPRPVGSRLVAILASWRGAIPRALREATGDLSWRGVVALGLVGLIAASAAAIGVWRSRPRAVAVDSAAVAPTTRAATSVTPPAGSAGPTVVVAVAGAVRQPGVFTLPAGSRVIDAVRAAGGTRPGTDAGWLNLARRLTDGEQVVVGGSPPPVNGAVSGPSPAPGAPVNLNTATVEQLDSLPGVGPVLAQRIVSYRTQHGGFTSVEQLREVGGIGSAKFADLQPLVTV